MKRLWNVLLLTTLLLVSVSFYSNEKSASDETFSLETPETRADKPETPADDARNAAPKRRRLRDGYLEREKNARVKAPEVVRGLKVNKKYIRRLPNGWRDLDLSDEQVEEIYAIQKDYFDEIGALEARIERLEKERDFLLRRVLTEKQREQLGSGVLVFDDKGESREASKDNSEIRKDNR